MRAKSWLDTGSTKSSKSDYMSKSTSFCSKSGGVMEREHSTGV